MGALRDNGDAWGQTGYRAAGLMANSQWRLGSRVTLRFFDDGVYDDPFASDARAGRAALKQVFARGASLEAWGLRLKRDFNGALALGLDGLPSPTGDRRRDRAWRAGVGLHWPLGTAREGAPRFAVALTYDFTDQRSNDAYYDYRSHTAGVALSLAY